MSNGLIEQIEQARCPGEGCDSVIDRRHLFININGATLTRNIKAFCDKCGRGWESRQTLRCGIWHDEPGGPAVRELTGKALDGLKRRVDMADGVTQALSA